MLLCAFSVLAAGPGCAASKTGVVQRGDYLAREDVQGFIREMVTEHAFEAGTLDRLFAQVQRQDRVLEVIQRPAEAKPWYEYRPIFLTDARIAGGVTFWAEHEAILDRAEARFGVAPEYVVAIIGVETYYGSRTGSFPVLDTLTTLGFDYPPRSDFFRRELEQYLLLTREESLDPLKLKGSYAGAMGKGQFISSSYRAYAVDFDDDGRRDLWESADDAIGSVANYFSRHGWEADRPVVLPARLSGEAPAALLKAGLKPSLSREALDGAGVTPAQGEIPSEGPYALIELEAKDGPEYWIGFNNFYVITRYNRSPLYAMAVHQLAQLIREAREASVRTAAK